MKLVVVGMLLGSLGTCDVQAFKYPTNRATLHRSQLYSYRGGGEANSSSSSSSSKSTTNHQIASVRAGAGAAPGLGVLSLPTTRKRSHKKKNDPHLIPHNVRAKGRTQRHLEEAKKSHGREKVWLAYQNEPSVVLRADSDVAYRLPWHPPLLRWDAVTTIPTTTTTSPPVSWSNRIADTWAQWLERTGFQSLDVAVAATYMLSAVVINAPTVLLPVMAADMNLPIANRASFALHMTSVATLGGALGKFCNGFVCQAYGARQSCLAYLAALTVASLGWSVAPTSSLLLASGVAMEFFHSIMWTTSVTVLSQHYDKSPSQLAKGITALSLGSTTGALASKLGLAVLLQTFHWRTVARGVSLFALGAMAMLLWAPVERSRRGIHNEPLAKVATSSSTTTTTQPSLSWNSIWQSCHAVFRNKLFWMLGMCHAISYLARSCDKVLGSFVWDMTHLPRHVCGGSTSITTLGFVYGLVSGQKQFQKLAPLAQRQFLNRRYLQMVVSALGLAACAAFQQFSTHEAPLVMAVSLLAFTLSLTYSISFQFYQFPSALASTKDLAPHRSVCISLLDALGFLWSAPMWALVGRMVSSGSGGWTTAWLTLAVCFAIGGSLAMKAVPQFMNIPSSSYGRKV